MCYQEHANAMSGSWAIYLRTIQGAVKTPNLANPHLQQYVAAQPNPHTGKLRVAFLSRLASYWELHAKW